MYLPEVNNYIKDSSFAFQLDIPLLILLLPAGLIVGLLYSGVYYHLWYFPALLISLWILKKWKKHFGIKPLLIISLGLLMLGATETYYGFFSEGIQRFLSHYYDIFFTTRNFLFFGLFYVVLGYYIGEKKEEYTRCSFLKMFACIFLLIAEGIILHHTARIDSNILIATIPLIYYLFIAALYIGPIFKNKFKYAFRDLSKFYYFVHPLVIFAFIPVKGINVYLKIALIILITHIISIILIKIKKRNPRVNI
jgi:hypothetical protein